MALVFSSPSGPAGAIVELVSPTGNIKSQVVDTAAALTSSAVSNLSTVVGATVTDALDQLDSGGGLFDDFDASPSIGAGAAPVAGAVMPTGAGNWFAQSLGTAAGGSVVQGAVSLANHPGILRLVTNVAINDAIFIHKGQFNNGSSQFMLASDVARVRVVAQVAAPITTMRAWFGIATALNSATFGAEAAAWLYDSSLSPNWFAIVRRGGVQVQADTLTPAVAADFLDFVITQPSSGNWEFRIDGVLVASLASPPGVAGAVNAGAFNQALAAAAARELQLDLFELRPIALKRSN